MKHFQPLSIIRGIGYLLVLTLFANCKKDFDSTNPSQHSESILQSADGNLAVYPSLSQTRTATFLNNLNNFRAVFGDQNYPTARAEHVAADDNIYASTSKLTAVKDSAASFTSNSISSLALQGFGFNIPEDATIENISVRVKRFKKGTPSV